MKVIVNNLAVEYKDKGDGPVILMLHGWWRSLTDFDSLSKILDKRFRIVRLDLPGFGKSQMPSEVWGVGEYVDFVKKFVEKINIVPSILLGHSFGGRIILKGVGQGTLDTEKIILISPAGIKTDGFRKKIFFMIAKVGDLLSYVPPFLFVRKQLRQKFYKLLGSEYLESGKMQEIFKAVVSEDLSRYTKSINQPTLLIWGENDVSTPLSQGKILKELLKNSELQTIKNADHFALIQKPEEVARLVNQFIR